MKTPLQTTDSGRQAQVRCAIYTRKSTDEGLEQEFNSLDAQREAAESYIQSQKGEGGFAFPNGMTTAVSPEAIWTALRLQNCSRTSNEAGSIV